MFKNIIENVLKKKLLFAVIVFCVLVVGISLGSAFLTKTINIGGRAKIENNWIIYFDNVVLNNNSVYNTDATKNARITDPIKKQNIAFSTNLSSIGEFYEFDVYTVNDGSIDAMIDSVEFEGLTSEQKEYISYTVIYDDDDIQPSDEYYSDKYNYDNKSLSKCDPLYGNTRRKIKVRVVLRKKPTVDSLELDFNFKINYIQLDNACSDSSSNRHYLKIQPNGGEYSGSSEETDILLLEGEDYEISIPTHDSYDFMMWDVISPQDNGTYSFENNKYFRMGEEDVTIRAKWDENYVASIGMCEFYQNVQSAFNNVDTYPNMDNATASRINGKKIYKNYTCDTSDNTVYLLKNHTESQSINNLESDAFKFDLLGHTLTGNIVNGSASNSSTDLTLVNGKIMSPSTSNEAVTNYGKLTMGVKDNIVNVENSITLVGNVIGLVNKSSALFYFYDGYIDALEKDNELGDAMSVELPNLNDNSQRVYTEDNYHIIVDDIPNGSRAYLILNPNRAVAKITTGYERFYTNLQKAFDTSVQSKSDASCSPSTNCNEKEIYTVYAIRDFEAAYELNVKQDERVFFDTMGYNIKFGENITIASGGYLDIYDSLNPTQYINKILTSKSINNNGTLYIENKDIYSELDANIINNNGTLNISDATLLAKKGYAINNRVYATVTLDEDTIIKADDNYGMFNESNVLVLNDGNIYGLKNTGRMTVNSNVNLYSNSIINVLDNTRYVPAINNTNIFTMNGGNASSSINHYTVRNTGTFNLNGGSIESTTTYQTFNNDRGTLNATGGEIKGSSNVISSGTINLSGYYENDELVRYPKITSLNGVAVSGSTITVSDGEVKSGNKAISGGTAVINGGTIDGEEYGIYRANTTVSGGLVKSDNVAIDSEDVTVSGGTINGYNNGIIVDNLTMTGGNVNSEHGVGITVNTNGTITGGTIVGNTNGVDSKGIITIGEDDYDNNHVATINYNTPIIKGELYGLNITGSVANLYDGILKGVTDGYSGEINGTPTGAILSEDIEEINNKTYNTDFVVVYQNWLRVGQQEFNNINAASRAIESNGTIEVIKDVDITFKQEFINYPDDPENINVKNITFDLNGHTITSTQSITNSVNLTIIDSSQNKTGTINPTKNIGIVNSKSLTLNGGIYKTTIETPILNNSTMIVNNALFDVTNTGITNGSSGHSSATLTINDIEFKLNDDETFKAKKGIDNEGTVTMKGGTIKAINYGIYSGVLSSSVKMKNGTIESNNHGVYNPFDSGSFEMDDGTINAKDGYGVYTYGGSVTINDGIITSINENGIYAGGNITINDGTVTGTIGVENHIVCPQFDPMCHWYDIHINGGEVRGTDTNGIEANGGKLFVYGGLVKGNQDGIQTSADNYIGLGMQSVTPVVIGERYSINTSSYTRFFGGILKSRTNDPTHNGLISEIPNGALIKRDYEFINGIEYKNEYLVNTGNWLRVGNEEFNSINDAAAAIDSEGTITVIADKYIDFEQILPKFKDITLDLNGHNVTMTIPIDVEGTATFIDSKGNGSINNIRDYAIINKGTTTIESGKYYSNTSSAIYNDEIMTINGGTFSTLINNDSENYPNVYAITNNDRLTINDGNIIDYGGIDNYKTLTINGGTIEGTNTYSLYNRSNTTITNGTIINNATNSIYNFGSSLIISGGNITSSTDNALMLYNYSNGSYYSVNITGGNLTGYKNGIFVNSSRYDIVISGGNITGQTEDGLHTIARSTTITGGKFSGDVYGVYTSSDLILGNDDGNIDIGLPELKGNLLGLYINSGDVNFYDGIIISPVTSDYYYGQIYSIAPNSEIVKEFDENYKTTYLYAEGPLIKIERIVDGRQEDVIFNNLQTAINNAENNETLIVIANAPLYYQAINTNKHLTLDMNGHTLSTNKGIINQSNGELNIINSSNNSAKIKTSSSINLIQNSGELSINNVTLENNGTSSYIVYNNSNLELTNTNISGINCINSTGELTITSSTVSAQNTAINSSGKLTITNGTYSGDSYSIYSNTTSNVSLTGANLSGTYYNSGNNTTTVTSSRLNSNVQNYSNNMTITNTEIYGNTGQGLTNNGTLVLDNVDFNITSTNNYGLYPYIVVNNSGTMTINNSNINVDKNDTLRNKVYAINNSSTLTINDSTIDIGPEVINNKKYTGINAESNGVATINNSDILVNGGDTSYGVYVNDNNSSVILKTGMIKVENCNTSYGAYIELGAFTMGENEGGTPSDVNPVIYSSGTRGIGVKKLNASFNFFDGKVWATRYSKPETTTNAPTNYEATIYLSSIDDVAYEYCHLEYMPDNWNNSGVAELNDVKYDTIQDAINHASSGDTIKILRSTTENFRVGTGKNVYINLNGHSVTANTNDLINTKSIVIEPGAALTVYNGSLQNFDNTTVINNGTFTMGINDRNVSSTSIRVISERTAVINKGTFIMYDGYLEGENALEGEINVKAEMSRIYTTRDEQSEKKYLQSLSEASIRAKETDLIIKIDPNNGLYEGSKDIKTLYKKFEQEYELTYPPVKNGCDFAGWEITENNEVYLLTGNTITMDIYDIDVKVLWEISDDAVAHIGDEYYTSLSDAINNSNERDEIVLLKDITENITVPNGKDVTLNLDEHKVTGEFINNGIVKILNGTIENPNGIGIVNNKTLTLGENDEDPDENYVKIIGTNIGIKQNGRLNFYDGYIEGVLGLDGSVTSVPQGFYTYTRHIDLGNNQSIQRIYLDGNPANAVAIINSGTTQYFLNIQDAIDAAVVLNKEILIIKNNYEGAYPITIPANKTINMNMQGNTITLGNVITNNGTLKIYDTEDNKGSINVANEIINNGTLEVSDITIAEVAANRTINNVGHLKLDNATITSTSENTIYTTGTIDLLNNSNVLSNSKYGIDNNQEEKLIINSGTISTIYNRKDLEIGGSVTINNTTTNIYSIYLPGNATFTMNNGTINASNYKGIYIQKQSNTVVINNGTITTKNTCIESYAYDNTKYNVVTINGGNITSTNDSAISLTSYSTERNTLNITNGNITGKNYAIQTSNANIDMSGGTLTSNYGSNSFSTVNCSTQSTYNISNGVRITGNYQGIHMDSDTCIINLDGAIIDMYGKTTYGVFLRQGILNIDGDTHINSNGDSSYGIYFAWQTATVNMYDGEINSANIGIGNATNYNYDRTVNIYGGRIIGETYGISISQSKTIINIGDSSDNNLSTTNPYISGGTYGVYKTAGTVNFYNGRLRGSTYGYSDELNAIRRGMNVEEEEENPDYSDILTYTTTDVSETATSNYAKKGNGYARLTYIGETNGSCVNNTQYDFNYTGGEQTFTTVCSGKYKVEVWGAQGGTQVTNLIVGYGGYSYGEINLSNGETLYINVGGQGEDTRATTGGVGGYNGGGAGGNGYGSHYGGSGGGGATHVATSSGLLRNLENKKDDIIIVAGGGGGRVGGTRYSASNNSYFSGSGGGYIGGVGYNYTYGTSQGGTQSSGAGFGYGSDGRDGTNASYGQEGNGGSGGGYYGGYTNPSQDSYTNASGSGGSGYIGSSRLSNAVMYGYNVKTHVFSFINNYLVEKEKILQVGDELFNNLSDAADAIVGNTGTIKLIKNAELKESFTFESGKTITFDLNGNTLTTSTSLISEGNLIVTDLTNAKNGKIVNTSSDVFENKGNITIEDIDIEASFNVVNATSGTGNIVISRGDFTGSSIVNFSSAQSLTMSNVNAVTSDNSLNMNVANTNLTINNSDIESTTKSAIYSNYKTTINSTNVDYTGLEHAIDLRESNSTFNATGGEITCTANNKEKYAIQNYGTMTLTNVDITAQTASGIYYNNNNSSTLSGVEINVGKNDSYGINLYNGTLNINDNTIINATGDSSYGIYHDRQGIININSGEINSANIGINAANSNTSYEKTINIYSGSVIGAKYGINIQYDYYTLNIGRENDPRSTSNPYIYGGKYAVNNIKGVVNYYNGKLRSRIFGYYYDFDNVRTKNNIYTEYELIENNTDPLTRTTKHYSSNPISEYAKAGNGFARLTYLGETNGTCTNGDIYNFDYTGSEQEFEVQCEGNYKIEVWGAAGGYTSDTKRGGYGGYSSGTIELNDSETLYINVGGQGAVSEFSSGGYNGGGSGGSSSGSGGGGGATHIATASGLLSELEENIDSILIVAGGGGGYANYGCSTSIGGSGGGYQGALATNSLLNEVSNTGGTQTSGGVSSSAASGSFGLGGYQTNSNLSIPGAGGGFYGGGTGHNYCGAGGGSGYISNSRLSNALMRGYNVPSTYFINNYLVDKDGFLEVNGTTYNSLIDAVNAITGTGTINVLNDGLIQEYVTIPSTKNITLNLNNNKLKLTSIINNQGIFTINDLSNNKKGSIENTKNNIVENSGTLNIENVTLETIKQGIVMKKASSVLNITSSTINSKEETIYNGVNNTTINITNSNISSSNNYAFITTNPSTITTNNSTFTGNESAVRISSAVTFTSTGDTFNNTTEVNDRYCIYIYNSGANVTFNNSTINAPFASGIYNNVNTTTLNGVRINAGRENANGIYSYAGTLNINGNTVIRTTGNSSYGIYFRVGTVNINSGEIDSQNIGVSTDSGSYSKHYLNIYGGRIIGKVYGLQVNNSVSEVTIGDVNENVSITTPYIEGGLYGINKTSGKVDFYSGLFKGSSKAYYGSFDNIREGYEVFDDFDNVEAYMQISRTVSTSNVSDIAISNYAKKGNGYAKVTYIETDSSTINEEIINNIVCDSTIGEEYTYYDNDVFVPNCSGKYKVELWGAQGGYRASSIYGGKGAYVSGEINLSNSDELKVYVGLSGNNGGRNGGGSRTIGYGGGGATDIRLTSNLYSRIMVAAGGGSDGATNKQGGYGGALTGQSRTDNYGTGGEGATQTGGGSFNGTFGLGGDGISEKSGFGGAGGGGWYGGGGVKPDGGGDDERGGGGGSSFIYNSSATLPNGYLVDSKYMISNSIMLSGGDNIPSKDGVGNTLGNGGDGFAKITLIEFDNSNSSSEYTIKLETNIGTISNDTLTYSANTQLGNISAPTVSDNNYQFVGWYLDKEYTKKVTSSTLVNRNAVLYAKFTYDSSYCSTILNSVNEFDYTGTEQVQNIYCSGKYKLEVWGAQGGSYSDDIHGGYGGYSRGEMSLRAGEKLYINVGGQGSYSSTNNTTILGGYNGGGNSQLQSNDSVSSGSGGGATSITTESGLLNGFSLERKAVIIVAGGGGGAAYKDESDNGIGGSGGGYVGADGTSASNNGYGTGGTQSFGGYFSYKNSSGIGSFGQGGNTEINNNDYYGGAGGGGFYGGGSSSSYYLNGGGGGSGYIDNPLLTEKIMYGYDVEANNPYEYANIAYLVQAHNFVTNKTTNEEYTNLQDAIDDAGSGDILELTSNASVSYDLTVRNNDNIILDLKGFNLQTSKTITNDGILTIRNTNNNSNSKLYSNIIISLITNNGTLNVNNITLECSKVIENKTGGRYTISDSTIIASEYGIYDSSTFESTVTNTNINSLSYSLYNYLTSTINANNCNITGKINTHNSNSRIVITGGTITGIIYNFGQTSISSATYNYLYNSSYNYAIYNKGTLSLTSNTINKITSNSYYTSTSYVIQNDGNLVSTGNTYKDLYTNSSSSPRRSAYIIYNTSITSSTSDGFEINNASNAYGIYNSNTNSSTVNSPSMNIHDNTTSYGIYNNSGTLVIDGGTSSISNSTNSYGIYVKDGDVTLKTGTYNVSGSTISYGIKQEDGAFTLGIYDGSGLDSADVSITDPHISAVSTNVDSGIGLSKVRGSFNFYDGYVIASKAPRDVGFANTGIEYKYQLVTRNDSSTGYDYCILEFIR